jgi:hypothetical protein
MGHSSVAWGAMISQIKSGMNSIQPYYYLILLIRFQKKFNQSVFFFNKTSGFNWHEKMLTITCEELNSDM